MGALRSLSLRAQSTFTWSNANHSTDDYVSDAANWVGGVAPSGTPDLIFGTASQPIVSLDVPFSVNSVTFSGGIGYGINGSNALTLAAGGFVTNNSTGSASILIAVPVTLNGTVTVNNTSATAGLLVQGVISGTGGLTINNTSGTNLQLNNGGAYTGTTTISSGTLQVGNNSTVGATLAGNVANSGTLRFALASGDSVSYAGVISGTGIVALNGTGTPGTVTFSGANTYSGNTQVNSVTLADGAANSFSPNSTIIVNSAGGSLTVNFNETIGGLQNGGSGGPVSMVNGGTTLTVSTSTLNPTAFGGVVSGAGGFALSGSGSLGFSGANTYTGGTTINGGTFFVANTGGGSATGTGTVTVGSGATLEFGQPGGGTSTASISGSIVDNGTVTFNLSGATTISNAISGTGGVTKTSSSGLTLTGANTYSGITTINAGTLFAANSSGSATGSGAISINSGGALQLGAAGGGAVGSVAGAIFDSGTLLFNLTGPLSFGNTVSGTGAVQQSGSNTVTFTTGGAMTYSGSTVINAGTIADGAMNAFSPNSIMVVKTGTNLQVNFNETIAGLTGSSGLGGTVGIVTGAILTEITSGSRFFPGVITGAGSLTIGGTGTEILAGTNTYTGNTTINSGATLQLGNGSTFSNGAVAGPVVDNGSLIFNQSTNASYSNSITGTGTVVVGGGSANVTITSANTYSGGTTVNGTLLVNNSSGSGLGSGPVSVSGGVLAGTGSFTGTLTINASSGVFPGTFNTSPNTYFPGTLTTGAATFGPNAGLVFAINNATGTVSTNWSLLSISGALAIIATSGSPFFIVIDSIDPITNLAGSASNFNPASPYSWEFAATTGGITGFAANEFTVYSVSNPYSQPGFQNALNGGSFSVSEVGNNLFLDFTPGVVPEPSTWELLLAGLPICVGGVWRRRRASRSKVSLSR